jgi:hypothetical protein
MWVVVGPAGGVQRGMHPVQSGVGTPAGVASEVGRQVPRVAGVQLALSHLGLGLAPPPGCGKVVPTGVHPGGTHAPPPSRPPGYTSPTFCTGYQVDKSSALV